MAPQTSDSRIQTFRRLISVMRNTQLRPARRDSKSIGKLNYDSIDSFAKAGELSEKG